MILKYLPRVALLAAAIVAMSGMSAKAAPLTYTAGDLILSFRSSSSTQSYLVNIGSASSFLNASGPVTLDLNMGADLTSLYGSNWSTSSDVFWSVVGTQTASAQIVYATRNEVYSDGVLSHATPWTNAGNTAINNVITRISGMSSTYALGESTANNSRGLIQTNGAAGDTTYFGNVAGGADFTYFTDPGVEGTFANGASLSGLDLFVLRRATDGSASTLAGSFTISSNGVLTFTPVPEPGTFALLGLGAVVAFIAVRRRARQVASV